MMIDDRVSCHDCRDLGRCRAPSRAEPDLLRRCEEFMPRKGAADQRTGAQRFPTLIAEREAAEAERVKTRRGINARGVERAKQAIGANA